MKITPPNYTQTPNDLFDKWLPDLNESELKVLMVVIRKTFGWHKDIDRISISQLQKITGLSETSVLNGIKSLIQKELIYKYTIGEIGKQQSFYSLTVQDSNNSYPPSNFGGPPQIVGMTPPDSGDTKETNSKETIQKKQQQTAAFAAASLTKKTEQIHIYECLLPLDIPLKSKTQITKSNSEESVISAVNLALSKKTPPKDLAAFINWAARENPIACKPIVDTVQENKAFAEEIKKKLISPKNINIEMLSKGVEFSFPASQKCAVTIDYSSSTFKIDLINSLNQYGFKKNDT